MLFGKRMTPIIRASDEVSTARGRSSNYLIIKTINFIISDTQVKSYNIVNIKLELTVGRWI